MQWSKKHEEEALLSLVDHYWQAFNQLILQLEVSRKSLQSIAEHPWSLESFSVAELMEINLTERKIPDMIRQLKEYQQTIPNRSEEDLLGDVLVDEIRACQLRFQKLWLFMDKSQSKLRKPIGAEIFFLWLLYPLKALSMFMARRSAEKIKKKYRKALGEKN